MSDSRDETQGLLDKTRQPSTSSDNTPSLIRSILSLATGQGPSGPNNNGAFVQEMDTIDKSTSSTRPINYGYLEHIQSLKSSLTPDKKSLPRKVKAYYEDQLELITSIEDVLLPKTEETKDHATAYEKQVKKRTDILSMATLITNVILVGTKIGIALVSNSLSIISSLVDSAVDVLISLILLWTQRKIKNRDVYKYPGGRKRLEPISIVILSVIMCSASILIIFKSTEILSEDVQYFTHKNNASSKYTLPTVNMGTVSIVVMAVAVVSKAVLFAFCCRIKNPTMVALAEANLNDVASNTAALICGVIASEALQGKIKQEAVVIDPIGAILISIYIIIAWILQANRQIRRLTGISAEPYFLQQLTHVVYNYRPDVVKKIDLVQAVYHGTLFFVETHIVVPGSMPLTESHDVGAQLQTQLETINDVERAFVHLDFESSHMPSCKHKGI